MMRYWRNFLEQTQLLFGKQLKGLVTKNNVTLLTVSPLDKYSKAGKDQSHWCFFIQNIMPFAVIMERETVNTRNNNKMPNGMPSAEFKPDDTYNVLKNRL